MSAVSGRACHKSFSHNKNFECVRVCHTPSVRRNTTLIYEFLQLFL
jgi:hypothetical protein